MFAFSFSFFWVFVFFGVGRENTQQKKGRPDDSRRRETGRRNKQFTVLPLHVSYTKNNRQSSMLSLFFSLSWFVFTRFFSSVLFSQSLLRLHPKIPWIFICFVCVYGPLYFLSMFPSCFVSDLKLTFVTVGLWLSRRHTAIQRLPLGARSEASVKLVAFPSATRQMLTRMGPWVITVGAPALAAFFLENLGENEKKKKGQVDQQHILLRSGGAAFNS